MTATNPLLQDWTTPHGLPPFASIAPEHFVPAFEAAMAAHRAELAAIVDDALPPDFDNTIAAFDRAGGLLARVELVFSNLCSSHTSPALQAIETEMAPKLAAHESAVYLNAPLFARIDAVHAQRAALGLSGEALRLTERVHFDFVLAGAQLTGDARAAYAANAERLAVLMTRFGQNLLADESGWSLHLTEVAELDGLPGFVVEAARAAAMARGLAGWVITLSRSLAMPFLSFSRRRDLREQVWRAFTTRGEHAGDTDNRPLMREILTLRQAQAKLHGHRDYARYVLTDTMAGTPEAVERLLLQAWEPAKRKVAEEAALLRAQAEANGEPTPIEPWDWRYLAEQVRAARYALDDAEIKPYFSLDAMIGAMFDCANRLFGLRFVELADAPRYHPDVRVWEVWRGETLVGVFMGDNYARPEKRSGAWMSLFRSQHRNGGESLPIVINHNNFAKGSPTLLSFDDVRTLFHEFGHGLHGLLSNVTYKRLAGTQVLRDFVELPSQIYENWALTPEVLQRHARHVETGEPIPAALIERIRAASRFNQGFETVEYIASALVDLALHQVTDPSTLDFGAFEAETLAQRGMPPAMVMRHRLPHFAHLFAGDGYAARYYVYLWAEVLDADGFNAFTEAGNVFDPATAERLYRHIYSVGNTVAPDATYRAFRGRDPEVAPMLRARGLLAEATA